MPPPTAVDEVLALVHQGWDHLRLQRPLAAWASWQRALRRAPEDQAAREALEQLANAPDLPTAARAVYRFRPPEGEARRARWDDRLRGHDLSELPVAAEAFRELAEADPDDAAAGFNRALCLAWMGANVPAIAALERVVALEAADAPDTAVDAWTLAEVLRHGAGAEHLADDMSLALVVAWQPEDGDPDAWGDLRPVEPPIDPA